MCHRFRFVEEHTKLTGGKSNLLDLLHGLKGRIVVRLRYRGLFRLGTGGRGRGEKEKEEKEKEKEDEKEVRGRKEQKRRKDNNNNNRR